MGKNRSHNRLFWSEIAKLKSKITWVITIVGLGQEEYPLLDLLVCNEGGFGRITKNVNLWGRAVKFWKGTDTRKLSPRGGHYCFPVNLTHNYTTVSSPVNSFSKDVEGTLFCN